MATREYKATGYSGNDYQEWTANGVKVFDVGPQEAAEQYTQDHSDAHGVVVVRDSDGLIAGEWNADDLRD